MTDSLKLARELHPGKRNSLDALCERYGVSNQHRTLHGALLDAGLLADVYLAMTRGQDTLMMDIAAPAELVAAVRIDVVASAGRTGIGRGTCRASRDARGDRAGVAQGDRLDRSGHAIIRARAAAFPAAPTARGRLAQR